MRNEAELRAWVEAQVGGPLARFERVGNGASRATWRADPKDPTAASVILRVDSGDGPLSGTELDLAREACVYRALRGTGVRIPALLAELGPGDALLVEHVAGRDDVASLAAEARGGLALDFMHALAALHRVEVDALPLDGFERPRAAGDHARLDLALWRRIHDARTRGEDAVLTFALGWLHEHAPEANERTSLCHGDAGAGNFLFEGDRVSALLDWEFAHLGDPLDDLAWVAVRAQIVRGFGDLAEGFACWASETGLTLDRKRIEYFRALVLARMAIACHVGLGHQGQGAMDKGVYEALLPYLRALLPDALERAGATRLPFETPEASPLAGVLGPLTELA